MKNKYQFISIILFFSVLQSNMVLGQDRNNSIKLSLKPKECVVYKEGDMCYATVRAKWSADLPASFCLFRTPGDVKLECWENVNEGQFVEELVMDEPMSFYLTSANSSEILIRETINLSWVHKKSSRPANTWRLF